MDKSDKIYIAGHSGLVGSALSRALARNGFENIVTRTHKSLDLTTRTKVDEFFDQEKPDHVFLAAARVGGIYANNTYPAEFIYENLSIQTNVIDAARKHGVEKLLFLGSSCIYPRECAQPIKEKYLLTGPLEATNRPYAVAKIAGVEMCWSYNRQYGTKYLAVMPTNLYGPGDNYDLETSHVVPALIRKMHEAKIRNQDSVQIWGTGKAKREFLYSEDMADACVYLMTMDDHQLEKFVRQENVAPLVNIGCGEDMTIVELAHLIAKTVGFKGRLEFDTSRPDGTPRKLLDVGLLNDLGWSPTIGMEEGLRLAYQDFLGHISGEMAS